MMTEQVKTDSDSPPDKKKQAEINQLTHKKKYL